MPNSRVRGAFFSPSGVIAESVRNPMLRTVAEVGAFETGFATMVCVSENREFLSLRATSRNSGFLQIYAERFRTDAATTPSRACRTINN
jgi:hypothetical protein